MQIRQRWLHDGLPQQTTVWQPADNTCGCETPKGAYHVKKDYVVPVPTCQMSMDEAFVWWLHGHRHNLVIQRAFYHFHCMEMHVCWINIVLSVLILMFSSDLVHCISMCLNDCRFCYSPRQVDHSPVQYYLHRLEWRPKFWPWDSMILPSAACTTSKINGIRIWHLSSCRTWLSTLKYVVQCSDNA